MDGVWQYMRQRYLEEGNWLRSTRGHRDRKKIYCLDFRCKWGWEFDFWRFRGRRINIGQDIGSFVFSFRSIEPMRIFFENFLNNFWTNYHVILLPYIVTESPKNIYICKRPNGAKRPNNNKINVGSMIKIYINLVETSHLWKDTYMSHVFNLLGWKNGFRWISSTAAASNHQQTELGNFLSGLLNRLCSSPLLTPHKRSQQDSPSHPIHHSNRIAHLHRQGLSYQAPKRRCIPSLM